VVGRGDRLQKVRHQHEALEDIKMNTGYMLKTNFGTTRGPSSAAMNLRIGPAFEGQPDLLRMIESAQRAQQVELVKALHEQYRMLLCTPAGVSPGDKEWPEWLKGFAADIGTIASEKEIPQIVFRIIRRIKRCRAGMLYLIELHVNGSSQMLSDADCKGTAVICSNCEIQP